MNYFGIAVPPPQNEEQAAFHEDLRKMSALRAENARLMQLADEEDIALGRARKVQAAQLAKDREFRRELLARQRKAEKKRIEEKEAAELRRAQEKAAAEQKRRKQEKVRQQREREEKRLRRMMDDLRKLEDERKEEARLVGVFNDYERKWTLLRDVQHETGGLPLLSHLDFPWPALKGEVYFGELTFEAVREFVFHDERIKRFGKTPRELLKADLLKWHSDKFTDAVLDQVCEESRELVKTTAELVQYWLNDLLSETGS